jgi:hypothetical protein
MGRILVVGAWAFCASLVATPAWGQPSAGEKALQERFRQLDKDGNGKITTDELPQSTFFKQRDKDGDGSITLAEAMDFLADSTTPDATDEPAKTRPPSTGNPTHTPATPLRQGPQPLRPGDHGVGRRIDDAQFKNLAGKSQRLSGFAGERATVIAMTSTSCPLSQKYLPTLAQLAKSYSQRDVAWILINPRATDKPAEMHAAAKLLGSKAIYVPDADGVLARAVGALTTTDVIVLDSARTVVYHGAVDDQYGQGYAVDAPRHRYLIDALDAMLAGRSPQIAATTAPGCALDLKTEGSARQPLTYHNRISRIVQSNCLECHRDDGVAPFSLATYEDVAAHAPMIKQVVEQGIMPPWFAASPGPASEDAAERHASLWAHAL